MPFLTCGWQTDSTIVKESAMQDIRFVDSDGEYLNLETQGGEKFRLILDDTLRSAVKRESQVQLDTVSISPREIQDLVRSGLSATDVANGHSVPLDYVEKFALTVVDEIGHIIASAKNVRIAVEADRYSEASQLEFGEILEGRLRKTDATNIIWSATKLEGVPWMVSVSYFAADENRTAVWSFDQRKLVLSPENELAVKLSAGDFAASPSTSKIRRVEVATEGTRVVDLPRLEAVSETESAAEASASGAVSSIEELTRSSLQSASDESQAESVIAEPLSPTADLLEALRKKRIAATVVPVADLESVVIQPEPEEPKQASEPEVNEIDTASMAPLAKKGRPTMPSWDEIVFGTKADD
jgi:hypothetical protein